MTLRERLRRLEQRLNALRDRQAAQRNTYTDAARRLADAPEDGEAYTEARDAARTAREAIEATQGDIERLQDDRAELLAQMALEVAPGEGVGRDDDLGVDDPEDITRLSRDVVALSRGGARARIARLTRGDAARRLAEIAHGSTSVGGRVSLGTAATRREFLAALERTDLAGLVQPDRRGLIAPTFEPLTFLDFLPFSETDSNLVQYVRAIQMPYEGAPVAPTREGEVKPEMGALRFRDEDAPIRTIAAWTVQKKQVLADAPFLEGLLQLLLVYEVRRALLAQLIAGDGTGENVLGLLNHPDVLEYERGTVDENENAADAVMQGVVEVEDHLRSPQVVLFNPRDRAAIRLMRSDSGAGPGTGDYLFGPPSQAGASTIWDLPMITERSLPQGTALVADAAGALGLLRSDVEVLASDSDEDNFRRNRITLLAELRAGLAVLRPDAFCKVNLRRPVAP